MSGLVLLRSFYDRSEAVIAKGALESAGLFAVPQNFEMLSVSPHLNMALGGFGILVREEDREGALALLDEAGFIHDAPEDEPRSPPPERLEVKPNYFLSALATFTLGCFGNVAIPVRTRRWRGQE